MADENPAEQQNPQDFVRMPEEEENFPQPSTKQDEPVPGPPPMQGMPEKPVKKKGFFTGLFAFIILLFLFVVAIGVFILMSVFIRFSTPLYYYAAVSVVSLAAGALIGLIAKELIMTDSGFLWACSLISCIAAGLVSTAVSIQVYLTRQLSEIMLAMAELGQADIGPTALLSLFAPASNPLTTALLIIIFFNLPVMIMFFKMKQKKTWHLVIYLLPIVIFLIIFYLLPGFIISQYSELLSFLP